MIKIRKKIKKGAKSIMKKLFSVLIAAAMLISAVPAAALGTADSAESAQPADQTVQAEQTVQKENIGRGAIGSTSPNGGVYLTWRLLETEPADSVSFNIYKNGEFLTNIQNTNYTDLVGVNSDKYTVASVIDGVEGEVSSEIPILEGYADSGYESVPYTYFDIPLQIPDAGSDYTYNANDASVGDVDGDGQYEIILKWDPSNSKDNSQSGVTGNVYIDCYEFDGTFRWRIDLGRNIRAGAHYTQFQVFDYDGDGKAEVAMKTAPGSKDGLGNYVSAAGNTDTIRNASDNEKSYVNSSGFIITGPEYLTVFNGETGAAMQTIDYEPGRGTTDSWGKSGDNTNRVDRFLACTAYLDGVHPSMVFCRGYYGKAIVVAYDWDGTNLTKRWKIDSTTTGNSGLAKQGNHQVSVADIDNDGFDEIVYGAAAIDHDGTLAHSTGWGHGDALHVSDFDNDGDQEIFGVLEEYPGEGFREGDGTTIWVYKSSSDDGRGAMAYFSRKYGVLAWDAAFGIRTLDGTVINSAPKQDNEQSNANFPIYWDGDLCREHFDGDKINKFNDDTASFERLWTISGIDFNNTTKRNPCLQADLFGDWREELILRTTDNTALRVFMSICPTDYMFTTFLQDHQYRMAVAWQNTAYNQPPHQSYYIGYDMNLAESVISVKDRNGTPIAGAEVSVGAKKAVTDENGNAGVKLETGEYEFTVDCDGYFSGAGSITVADGDVGGTSEIVLNTQYIVGNTWTFNDLEAGTVFEDGNKIANEKGNELAVAYGTASITDTVAPKIAERSSGDNYLLLTDKGKGMDGWVYEPETPIESEKVVIETDFMMGDTDKDTILLRVFDGNNVNADNTYGSSDGRAFEVKTGSAALKITDYFSMGSSATKGLDTDISGFTFAANKWYGLKVEYTKENNRIKIYTKPEGGSYTLRMTYTLGSGTSKVSSIPALAPTKISGITRGSSENVLGVDNIMIGAASDMPDAGDVYTYTINGVTLSDGGAYVNITKNSDSGETDTVIVAAYDSDTGVLKSAETSDVTMAVGDTADIFVPIEYTEADKVIAYIWGSTDDIIPLTVQYGLN